MKAGLGISGAGDLRSYPRFMLFACFSTVMSLGLFSGMAVGMEVMEAGWAGASDLVTGIVLVGAVMWGPMLLCVLTLGYGLWRWMPAGAPLVRLAGVALIGVTVPALVLMALDDPDLTGRALALAFGLGGIAVLGGASAAPLVYGAGRVMPEGPP